MDNDSGLKLKQIIENSIISETHDEVDPQQLRYAVYARKSTEGAERQARSIPDQIEDCYEMINRLGIIIRPKDIFEEERSAKEAGEIIDLIDRNVIKDMRFARAHFENTPNGKMTLGISFVLSKHYSEHLSESVNRGNRRITEKGGVLNKFKHGYRVMSDNRLVADDDNYLLIQKAFDMRKNGATQKTIADFLNSSSYQYYYRGKGHNPYKFDEDAISKMLRDPIYAGVIRYGNLVGLVSDYDPLFTPMLTGEEFLKLHGEKNFLSKSFRASTGSVKADNSDFLRRCVICGHCGRPMTTSTATSGSAKKTTYFYYRCENKGGCINAGTGPRGAVILDYVIKFLDKYRFTTESNYQSYKADIEEKLRFDSEENQRIINQATTFLSNKKREFENAKAAAADKDNPIHIYYTAGELKKLEEEIKGISEELKKAKEQKSLKGESIMTYEEFLELFNNTVEILRSTNHMSIADEIIRIFFSNFTVTAAPKGKKGKQKQWSVTGHCLCKPFDEFVKNNDFLVWSG